MNDLDASIEDAECLLIGEPVRFCRNGHQIGNSGKPGGVEWLAALEICPAHWPPFDPNAKPCEAQMIPGWTFFTDEENGRRPDQTIRAVIEALVAAERRATEVSVYVEQLKHNATLGAVQAAWLETRLVLDEAADEGRCPVCGHDSHHHPHRPVLAVREEQQPPKTTDALHHPGFLYGGWTEPR